jgi:hypothetical protein
MIRINEIVDEIEDMLYDGYSTLEVANKLMVPIDWVMEVNNFITRSANEDSFVTQEVTNDENLSIIEEYDYDLY